MSVQHAGKIHELLEQFDTAMLVTLAEGEVPHARPMALAGLEPNCDVWFFTRRDNTMIQELQNDQTVLIVCQGEELFVSLKGRAELVVDRTRAGQMWHESYAKWFPAGVQDSALLLIHVRAEAAEYWDRQHPNGETVALAQATNRSAALKKT